MILSRLCYHDEAHGHTGGVASIGNNWQPHLVGVLCKILTARKLCVL